MESVLSMSLNRFPSFRGFQTLSNNFDLCIDGATFWDVFGRGHSDQKLERRELTRLYFETIGTPLRKLRTPYDVIRAIRDAIIGESFVTLS